MAELGVLLWTSISKNPARRLSSARLDHVLPPVQGLLNTFRPGRNIRNLFIGD